jgi:5'-3' exonuclease
MDHERMYDRFEGYFTTQVFFKTIKAKKARFRAVKTGPRTRAKKQFSRKSKSGKRAAALDVRNSFDEDAIMKAARQILIKKGQKDMALLVLQMENDPSLATKLKKKVDPNKISPSEALAFIMHKNISRDTYLEIRDMSKATKLVIWPSWKRIQVSFIYLFILFTI